MKRFGYYIYLIICISLFSCNKSNHDFITTESYSWKNNQIIQNDYIATAINDTCIISNYKSDMDTSTISNEWRLTNDISTYPQYQAPTALEVAIYNMSLDEMINAIESDSTLRTGAEWAGVWTRDVSYSIILSMAHMQTSVSINSLLQKISSRFRIIQDISSNRRRSKRINDKSI